MLTLHYSLFSVLMQIIDRENQDQMMIFADRQVEVPININDLISNINNIFTVSIVGDAGS